MAAGSSDSKGAVFLESEIEFIAENELVSIVPNFRADALHLHAGDIGPFRPQRLPCRCPYGWPLRSRGAPSAPSSRPPGLLQVTRILIPTCKPPCLRSPLVLCLFRPSSASPRAFQA
ncbi:unnamed protein product [Closterium sp. Naga37s-1]|nr:unnamed protein product [Closterium sp. Naga37s-1]